MDHYQVPNPKLADIIEGTIRITRAAGDLGAVTATTLTIPLVAFSKDVTIAAANVLVARNLTDATALTPSVVGDDLVLTDVALAAGDIIDLVIKVK